MAARSAIKLLFGHDKPKGQAGGVDDWTLQSDHGAFHTSGIPFVYFGVEDHPDYHKPTDTPEKIDATFFARVASGYAARAAADPARFVRVHADQPREAVWSELENALRAKGILQ